MTIGQIVLIAFVIAFWHLDNGPLFDPFFVGNPVGAAKVLINHLSDPRFYNDLWITGTERMLGYLLGGLSGIALCVVFAR